MKKFTIFVQEVFEKIFSQKWTKVKTYKDLLGYEEPPFTKHNKLYKQFD